MAVANSMLQTQISDNCFLAVTTCHVPFSDHFSLRCRPAKCKRSMAGCLVPVGCIPVLKGRKDKESPDPKSES